LPTNTNDKGDNATIPHIDKDSLLQADHVHDESHSEHNFRDMQIRAADEDFQDAEEQEDFYYDDYNDDDEEQVEIWEDVEEIYLDVPPRIPKLLHTPNRRGEKRMRMQRLPGRRYDAEPSAPAASLFLSPPQPT
jgi:hypothetical protein